MGGRVNQVGWLRRAGLELAAVGLPALAVIWAPPAYVWSTVAALVACALLPLRHVWPPLAVLGGLWGMAGGLGWSAAIVSLYALGRRNGRLASTLLWLVLPVAAAVVPVLVTEDLPWQRVVLTVVYVALIGVAPAFVGLLMSHREQLTRSLRELEQVREDALTASQDAARAQERARIGREIHDAVGHHATLIAVGAAALAASTQEDGTREAAERIRGLAKRALAEMRVALGLADGGSEARAGLAEMAALVAGARAAGVDVEITHHGDPRELASGVGRAVYRVVQESLTNAARHAPGASVRVDLTWHPHELRVQVVNSAPARSAHRRRDAFAAGGAGLSGLVERVATAGGELSAGTSAGGGFAVRARFPLAGSVAFPAVPPVPAPAL